MAEVKIDVKVIVAAALSAVRDLSANVKGLQGGFDKVNKSVKGIGNTFKNVLGANLATAAILKLKNVALDFVKSTVKLTGQLETTTSQFEVLTGSVEVARKTIKDLQEFSARTPFQFAEITEAGKRLLSFGFSVESISSRLQVLGDISAASGANISELSLIYGQVAAAGKLTGERLLQLQERAIPIGPALAKTLGVAESSVRDLVKNGKVDFATFERAFNSLNATGQFAFDGMNKRARTLEGQISTLKDNFDIFQQTIGQQLAPALKAVVTSITQLLSQITRYSQNVLDAESANTKLLGALSAIVKVAVTLFNGFNGVVFVMSAISGATLKLASGVLYLATGPMRLLVNALILIGDAAGINTDALKSFDETVASVSASVNKMGSSLLETADDAATSITKASMAADEFSDNLADNLGKEIKLVKDSANARDAANARKIASDKNVTNQMTAEQLKQLEAEVKFENERKKLQDELLLAATEAQLIQDGTKSERDELELLQLQNKLANQRSIEEEDRALKLGDQKAFDSLVLKNAVDRTKRENELALKQKQVEQKAQQERLSNYANMFGGLAALAATGGAKLFKITQAFQLAETITSGILAVQKAASAAPFPANVPGIIAETARATASVIRIKQTAPGFEQGGIVGGNSFSGDQIQARVNSGEMILNRQQQSQLFAMANGGGSSGQVIQVNSTIMLDGEVVGKAVSRQVADGLKLGEVF